MSPFFPHGHRTYKSSKVATKNDGALCELGSPPQSYKYYSKNSAKARKIILETWETQLAEELGVILAGFENVVSTPNELPFASTRTLADSRYYNTLPIYSGSSGKDSMAAVQQQKGQSHESASLVYLNNNYTPELSPDIQDQILRRNSSESGADTSWQVQFITTSDMRQQGEYGHDSALGFVTAVEECIDVHGIGQSPELTLNASGDGVCDHEQEYGVSMGEQQSPVVLEQELKNIRRRSLFNTLLRRPHSVTQSLEQQASHLSVHIAPTIPARLKIKARRGKKEQVVHFDMQKQVVDGPSSNSTMCPEMQAQRSAMTEGSIKLSNDTEVQATLSNSPTHDRQLPTISHCSRLLGSIGKTRSSCPTTPMRTKSTHTPSTPSPMNEAHKALHTTSLPTAIPGWEDQASKTASPNSEERLQHTILDDLHLGEGDTLCIDQLMREIEYDKNEIWENPSPGRPTGGEVTCIPFDTFEHTGSKFATRLSETDNKAASQTQELPLTITSVTTQKQPTRPSPPVNQPIAGGTDPREYDHVTPT